MYTDLEFFQVLFRSPTFTELLCGEVVLCIILIFASIVIIRKFKIVTPGKLWSDTRGSANAVDFVLVIPIFMTVIAIFVQLALIVNTSLIVHYAAYSAARSARIVMWNHDVWEDRLWKQLPQDAAGLAKFTTLKSRNKNDAEQAAEAAARYVLIAASPVNPRVPSAPKEIPKKIIERVSDIYLSKARSRALLQQAKYAYDSNNVEVTVSTATSEDPILSTLYFFETTKFASAWPVTVKVSYRMHLGVPFAAVLGDYDGGRYYKEVDAEVTLL